MHIQDKIYYVGVNDRTKHRFEGLWPLPYGVSYNSYLIADDDKVALVDTVDVAFFTEYIEKIKSKCSETSKTDTTAGNGGTQGGESEQSKL